MVTYPEIDADGADYDGMILLYIHIVNGGRLDDVRSRGSNFRCPSRIMLY
jgi:hypothetical protein